MVVWRKDVYVYGKGVPAGVEVVVFWWRIFFEGSYVRRVLFTYLSLSHPFFSHLLSSLLSSFNLLLLLFSHPLSLPFPDNESPNLLLSCSKTLTMSNGSENQNSCASYGSILLLFKLLHLITKWELLQASESEFGQQKVECLLTSAVSFFIWREVLRKASRYSHRSRSRSPEGRAHTYRYMTTDNYGIEALS